MTASKVIIFVVEPLVIIAVYCATTVHVIVCMMIWMIRIFSAHSCQLIQSTMYLNTVHKRIFVSSQFINVTTPSIAFRWAGIPTVSSCVQLLMWLMHTVQHGIIMNVLDGFKNGLSVRSLAKLDRMAIIFDKTCCQSICPSFPRTDFARGITNFTMVECSEQSGALFLIASFRMQLDGWQFLDQHFLQLDAVLGTMESLLCFEAWLEQYSFWEIGDPDGEAVEAEAAIRSLIRLITTFLPRDVGNGWKLSKFHEIKHIVRFIGAFGAPRGYNASRPEEHHKAHAQRPGRWAQKNVDTIDQQCGKRGIVDTFAINTMHRMLEENPGWNASSRHIGCQTITKIL